MKRRKSDQITPLFLKPSPLPRTSCPWTGQWLRLFHPILFVHIPRIALNTLRSNCLNTSVEDAQEQVFKQSLPRLKFQGAGYISLVPSIAPDTVHT